jgi:hypothetical protein
MIRFLKEPLVHFVLIGAAVYLLFGMFGQSDDETLLRGQNTIVVTQGEVSSLTEVWEKQWKRAPTPQELKGLLDHYVRETVLYREALAMGLEKNDTIVRRRLAQKLEFLSQDLIQPKPPSDAELRAWFDKNVDRYRLPELITFTHVFLDPDKRDQQTLEDAERLKAELIASAKPPSESTAVGDPFLLQRYYPERSEFDLSKLFGREFASSVMALEPGQWHGPVLSGYGVHLVYVHGCQEFPTPEFEQVADRVREDWTEEKRQELNDQYIASLLDRYDVVIEDEESDGETNRASGTRQAAVAEGSR